MERTMKMYDNKIYGVEVSEYGLEKGYLDYLTLSKIVGDCVLNNYIYEHSGYENWELYNGLEEDEDGNYYEIYQYYIISESGARFLRDYTDEIVFYNEELDLYLWGIAHFGTAWSYVLTNVRLIGEDDPND